MTHSNHPAHMIFCEKCKTPQNFQKKDFIVVIITFILGFLEARSTNGWEIDLVPPLSNLW